MTLGSSYKLVFTILLALALLYVAIHPSVLLQKDTKISHHEKVRITAMFTFFYKSSIFLNVTFFQNAARTQTVYTTSSQFSFL